MLIDGNKISEELLKELIEQRKKLGKIKLAVIAIGNFSEKTSFINVKKKFAEKLDISFNIYEIHEDLSRQKLRRQISQIVRAKTINGAIIQLPLPLKFPTRYFLNAIIPEKDADCLSARCLGNFYTENPIVLPPAVEVVDFIKNKFALDFTEKSAVVAGYGNLVGKPITHYLLKQKATVSVINSKTPENIKEKLFKEADIIISGAGKKNLITDCREGAVIIDFGFSAENNRIYGDIDFDKIKDKTHLITPTPGGTGPILVAMLYKNLLKLAKNQL